MIVSVNDKTNFPHKLLIPDGQVANLQKNFPIESSAAIFLSKTWLSKIIQSDTNHKIKICFKNN